MMCRSCRKSCSSGLTLSRVAAVARAAMAQEQVWLALDEAPVDGGMHALELHTSELAGPLVLLATPVGPKANGLSPLRVRPLHSAQAGELDRFLSTIAPAEPSTPPPPIKANELDDWLQDYLAGVAGDDAGAAAQAQPRGEQLRSFLSSSALPTLNLVSMSALPTIPSAADAPLQETTEDIRDARAGARAAAPSGPDPLIGRTLAGRVRIDAFIARGGMARVYRAYHYGLKKAVAVKVMHAELAADPACVRRFRREAVAHARIVHPNVLHVHDFVHEGDDPPHLIMDLVPGRDLRSVLDEQRRLPMARIVSIMSQVCAALAEAHARGVVHRDIKPANIMVHTVEEGGESFEHVTVCDFGLAKAYGQTPKSVWGESSPVTAIGATVGTPEYLAPEQALGEECDPRTDIYTCGAVMYEMATGQILFTTGNLMGLLVAVATKAPRPPSEVYPAIDPAFEAVILKALSKNRSLRQQTAQQLRQELLALVPQRRQTRRWSPR
jgi:serine/threonine-protein kinase